MAPSDIQYLLEGGWGENDLANEARVIESSPHNASTDCQAGGNQMAQSTTISTATDGKYLLNVKTVVAQLLE